MSYDADQVVQGIWRKLRIDVHREKFHMYPVESLLCGSCRNSVKLYDTRLN